jgi:peptidyl-prolyl cis-trans isomerase SurA
MLQRIFTLVAILAVLPLCLSAQSQQEDPVLFTVGDTDVHVSEFKYIYSKTNGQEADYSKKSLEDYLDLYIKFKLKVEKAKELQLDTIPSLQRELEGYRKQLADSYLIDREVTDKLLRELYERVQKDVQLSHIFVQIGQGGRSITAQDTLDAYNKAWELKKRLDEGEAFEKLAREESDDQGAAQNDGNLGFLTAPLPNGFYELEKAAYDLPVGEISDPVRSRLGYHIIRVEQRRPARGEIEVAHILMRAENKNFEQAKTLIDEIYADLQAPDADFEKIARERSDDEATASRGGYLGIFGIGRYEKSFEDAAFALEEDGAISEPVRTSIGWHIIKRISKRDIQPFEIEKNRLEVKIKQDSRFEEARLAMLERIRQENNFTENEANLQRFIASQDSASFFGFRWQLDESVEDGVLFTLGDEAKKISDFATFLKNATGKRIRLKSLGVANAVQQLYAEYVDDACMRFEEAQLEKKYPEFRSLMREYQEGILLFEATRMLVWDRASQDTVGLKAFYQKVKDRYRWNQRAVIRQYNVQPVGRSKVQQIRDYVANNDDADEVLAQFNTDERVLITFEEKTIERQPEEEGTWRVGDISGIEVNRDGVAQFYKILEVLPPRTKTLQEARGYIIADYQDYLENRWVEELREEYDVEVNQKVFKSLIKI